MSAWLKDGKMKHSILTAKVKLNNGLLMPIVGCTYHFSSIIIVLNFRTEVYL